MNWDIGLSFSAGVGVAVLALAIYLLVFTKKFRNRFK